MSFDNDELLALLPNLRRYAHKLTLNTIEADDLIQITAERALAKRDLFITGTNLQYWLFTIMRNEHISRARHRVRRAEYELTDMISDTTVSVSDPSAGLLISDLITALKNLPAEHRRVVMLASEGRSYKEIATREMVQIGTIRSRLWRGRNRLRALMEGI